MKEGAGDEFGKVGKGRTEEERGKGKKKDLEFPPDDVGGLVLGAV